MRMGMMMRMRMVVILRMIMLLILGNLSASLPCRWDDLAGDEDEDGGHAEDDHVLPEPGELPLALHVR